MRVVVKTYPDPLLVVSLNDAKLHLGIDTADTSFDTELTSAIKSAVMKVEGDTGRYLGETVFTMILDDFNLGDCIFFPYRPLVSIDAINYTDSNGSPQTLTEGTDFEVYSDGDDWSKGYIRPIDGLDWPDDVRDTTLENVEIDFTAGWSASTRPDHISWAVRLIVAGLFDNRGGSKSEGISPIYQEMIGHYKEW